MLSYYDNPNENSIFCPLHISAHYPGQMLIFLSRNAARKVSFTSHLLLILFLLPQAAAQSFSQNECSLLLLTWRWWPNDCWERISDNTATQRPRSGYCVGRVSGRSSAVLLWQHLRLFLTHRLQNFVTPKANLSIHCVRNIISSVDTL